MGTDASLIGKEVGRYRVEDVISDGEQAVIYGMVHTQLKSKHTLKLLHVANPELLGRLQQQGTVQANLKHKNLVAVTDIVEIGGMPGLIQRRVDGVPLSEWIAEEKPDFSAAMQVFKGLVAGLNHAHSQGLVHRDLHPGTVFVERDDFGWSACITDFGLVKILGAAGLGTGVEWAGQLSTMAFAAPEQLTNPGGVDHKADMYSLGCLLYEMVLHRPAYPDPIERMRGTAVPEPVVEEEHPPLFYELLAALLAHEPDKRPADMEAVREMVAGVGPPTSPQAQVSAPSSPASAAKAKDPPAAGAPSSTPSAGSTPATLAVAAVVMVLLVLLAVLLAVASS